MSFNVTEIFEIPIGIGNITVENLLYFAVILIIGVTVARVVSTNVRRALLERLPKNERELLTKLVYYVI
ncbi:MAG: mechanosensitive ion channel family protein, partial [Methanoculleus sp.]|nr:mechanosensitive ion channel family protein [Methanoculleus sp.]